MKTKIILIIIIIILILVIYFYSQPIKKKDRLEEKSNNKILQLHQPVQIVKNQANQENAAIFGDRIVWQDDRDGQNKE